MRDLTPQEHRALDRRVCQVLRGLQLYDARGAEDGAFAQDAAVLSGFVRGEIREALYHAAQRGTLANPSLCSHNVYWRNCEHCGTDR
jgi:hypothetical protein